MSAVRAFLQNSWVYWISILFCICAAGYCFLWSIQTAWIGSFPGRDVALYRRRFYMQLGASIVFFALAITVAIFGRGPRKQTSVPTNGA